MLKLSCSIIASFFLVSTGGTATEFTETGPWALYRIKALNGRVPCQQAPDAQTTRTTLPHDTLVRAVEAEVSTNGNKWFRLRDHNCFVPANDTALSFGERQIGPELQEVGTGIYFVQGPEKGLTCHEDPNHSTGVIETYPVDYLVEVHDTAQSTSGDAWFATAEGCYIRAHTDFLQEAD